MSLAEIEAELAKLTAEELRELALRSWSAYVQRERGEGKVAECSEDDARLLAVLDEALTRADQNPEQGVSGAEVRKRIRKWSSK